MEPHRSARTTAGGAAETVIDTSARRTCPVSWTSTPPWPRAERTLTFLTSEGPSVMDSVGTAPTRNRVGAARTVGGGGDRPLLAGCPCPARCGYSPRC